MRNIILDTFQSSMIENFLCLFLYKYLFTYFST